MIYEKITELIGKTPLLRLNNVKKALNYKGDIFAKLEYFNPTGSVKDRAAYYMLQDAISKGLINKSTAIIEPTSGNTGIGIASVCASIGNRAILVMPDNMSKERIAFLKGYGAEVVLTDKALGMQGAVEQAKRLKEQLGNAIILSQFTNVANINAHYNTTAPEIVNDLPNVDVVIAGIGTGGTISGIGKYFKEYNFKTKIIGVEPFNSPLITKGYANTHGLQGIGANFIPELLDMAVIDEVVTATEQDSYETCKMLAKREGVLVGITSGAVLSVAIKLLERAEYKDKNIVCIMPDSGDRYLSTGIYD